MQQSYLTADTETFDGLRGQKFACGCVYNGTNTYTFTDVNEFVETLLRYEYPRYKIFFHNSSFDIRFILQYCRENKILFPSGVIRGGTYISQDIPSLKNGNLIYSKNILTLPDTRYTRIQDSYAIIQMPLDKFTRVFGLKDVKLNMDFSKTNDLDTFIKRCRLDVKILYDGLEKMFELFPTTKYSLSLPQASMKEFLQNSENFMFTTKRIKKDIIIDSLLEQEARLGYFGGRNEIFKFNYFDKVYYYDKNSLYPFVMRNNYYPIGIKEEKPNKSVLNEKLYYVNATIELPYMYIPPLPLKKDKLYFTYGKMTGWFYSPEFNIIKDMCESITINKAYSFTPTLLFKEFIDKYWNMRVKYINEGNNLQSAVKLYMNSLYGKFGQKRECENRSYLWDIAEGCEELTDGVFTKTTKSYSKARFINPFVSGFITSYARAELYKSLDSDSIICDTDSVITTKQVNNVGTDLGQFKLEGIGQFQAFAPKTYFFMTNDNKEHNKAKGVYKEFIKGATPEEFINNIKKTEKYIYAKPKESIRRFGDFMNVKHIIKELSFINNKRIILNNRDTEPYDARTILAR